MAKTGIDPYPQGATIACCCQLLDHVWGADVGQHTIITDHIQGIVPEDVGREHDLGDRGPQVIASGLGA